MRKIDQYVRGMEFCLANAAKAPFHELRVVWQTLGDSYAYLVELESGSSGAAILGARFYARYACLGGPRSAWVQSRSNRRSYSPLMIR